jgi:phospholipase C
MPLLAQQPLLGSASPLGPWPCGWVDPATGLFSVAKAGGSNPDPPFSGIFASGGGLPVAPFDLQAYDPTNTLTGDISHIFWHEQMQIDTGKLEPSSGTMDKFVAYSSNPGYVLSSYDATTMPEGQIAQRYTIADNLFHSAFGGSFLNHIWLVCACTPQWNQPLPQGTAATTFESYWDPNRKQLFDSHVTLMPMPQVSAGQGPGQYWVVNTSFTTNDPHPPSTPHDQLLNPIPPSQKTIGDLLTDATPSVSWRWYSGGWNDALANPGAAAKCQQPIPGAVTNDPPGSGVCFQFHHQPFAYFQRWGSTGDPTVFHEHLKDEQDFLQDLRSDGGLPSVAFVKAVGVDNEHPNYSAVLAGQAHVQQLIAALCASPYWPTTAVVIAYDENGGRWDHVRPPAVDQWGPGSRVPAIIVSPYARQHYVDHTQYETVSILALIEKRFGLPALGARDAAQADITKTLVLK